MRTKRKWLAAGVCLLLAQTMLFGACGKKPAEVDPPVSGSEAGSDELQELVPTRDMGDRDFVILSDIGDMMSFHDYTGVPVMDEEVNRTLYIEDRFHVVCKTTKAPTAGQAATMLQQSELAGGGDYDLVYPHPTEGAELILTAALLTDLTQLSYLNLEREWYNQSQVREYVANGKLYLATSDISVPGQGLNCLLFNRQLWAGYGFEEDLYQTVKDGNWTIEHLTELVRQTGSATEDGSDGRIWGLSYRANITASVMYALGGTILKKDGTGTFELAFDTKRLTDMSEKLSTLLYNTGNVTMGESDNAGFPTSEYWLTFSGGRALFFTMDIGQLYNYLSELSFDVGYLPLPKLYETDSYQVNCASGFFGIPAHAPSLEESAIIFESLSIYSYEHLKPVFFNSILLGRLSEKPDDYDMLNYLHSIKIFDFGFTFDATNRIASNILYNVVITGKQNNASRAISAYLRGQKGYFDKLLESANSVE